MKSSKPDIYTISSISQLMRELGQPEPLHPLIGLIDYSRVQPVNIEMGKKICLDLYKISFKTSFRGQVKYGKGHYDFEEGGLAFIKPLQIVFSPDDIQSYEGYALFFHPDFIRGYAINHSIDNYGFFSYATSEALFLSHKEKVIISNLFATIAVELENNIDAFRQSIIVSHIEQLLNYSNRFYNRQFITRKSVNNEIVTSLDNLLNSYFNDNKGLKKGLPSVQHVCEQLGVSMRYLSDMLRTVTGMNTQQYVQHKMIEYSKDLLSATSLSVAEIAYRLGFEHPQSFSKLFKSRINQSPLAYRQSFN